MSAEVLREAAALIRERADAATPSDRWATGDRAVRIEYQLFITAVAHVGSHANAEHIASWHPDVALAVADWLDEVAAWRDEGLGLMPDGNLADAWLSVERQAKVVARAYLGEA